MTDEPEIKLNLEALKSTRIQFRDKEMETILLAMRNGIHTYVYGSVGTGKTTAVSHVMGKFENGRNKALYVSCSVCQTEYAVLREIIDQVNTRFPQKIFIQTRSNYDLAKRLKKDREKLPELKAVILDDLQSLEEPKVVDPLLEIGLILVLVADDLKAINRVSSLSQSYFGNVVHFEDYTKEQLTKIIAAKARHLLGEGRYKPALVQKLADLCNGNVGYAESLLLASVLRAVSLRKEIVDEADVPDPERPHELNHDEQTVFEILKEHGSMPGGELYRQYCEKVRFPKAERTFRNYMRDLCERNLVKAVGTNKGRIYQLPERPNQRKPGLLNA